MRRIFALVTVALVMAAMIALSAGAALGDPPPDKVKPVRPAFCAEPAPEAPSPQAYEHACFKKVKPL